MKRTTLTIVIAILLFSLGYATGKHKANEAVDSMDHSSMGMQEMMTAMNANLVGKTGDAFDAAFLEEMIMHHQGAVEMAELALQSAKHQEIKDLAEAIISAQNKEIADMNSWLSNWYGHSAH